MTSKSITRLPISKNQEFFRDIAHTVMKYAASIGASDSVVEVSESCGLSVSVRNQNTDTVEQNRDRGVTVTVYNGSSRGNASTSDFSEKALKETVEAAWHIARYTASDPAAALPDKSVLATEFPDLDLYHPWDITTEDALNIALNAEQAALEFNSNINNSEGASLDTSEGHFVLANSQGFMAGYPYTRHSMFVSPIAGKGENMQRDYWYSSARSGADLQTPVEIGRVAAQRAVSRMGARRLGTGKFPVVFEAPLAIGLLGAFVRAASGGALYRKASFLLDTINTDIFSSHVNISEDPFLLKGMGSSSFDNEGVKTSKRNIVVDGNLQSYFLSSYTARKLGMKTTGNAGGAHNITLSSKLTSPEDSLDTILKKMGKGLLVTELMGQGINMVTGDYSRGAFGYWVEDGEIAYPVQEFTIAGNLTEMFKGIVAIGADTITRGASTSGSVLIEQMSIAGQ